MLREDPVDRAAREGRWGIECPVPRIGSWAAIDDVDPTRADQHVVPRAAVEAIGSEAPVQRVVAVTAREVVVPVAGVEVDRLDVGQRRAQALDDRHRTRGRIERERDVGRRALHATDEDILSGAAIDYVDAGAVDVVVSAAAIDDVVARAAVKIVVPVAPGQVIVARTGREVDALDVGQRAALSDERRDRAWGRVQGEGDVESGVAEVYPSPVRAAAAIVVRLDGGVGHEEPIIARSSRRVQGLDVGERHVLAVGRRVLDGSYQVAPEVEGNRSPDGDGRRRPVRVDRIRPAAAVDRRDAVAELHVEDVVARSADLDRILWHASPDGGCRRTTRPSPTPWLTAVRLSVDIGRLER